MIRNLLVTLILFSICIAGLAYGKPIDVCEWKPAHNVYTGTPQAAIMAFEDIPLSVRQTLIERVTFHELEYSDVVAIRKSAIVGRSDYLPGIAQMHFGSAGALCKRVTRAKWSDTDSQSGIVYCEDGYCIVRPSVCNNWARIEQVKPAGPIGADKPVEGLIAIPAASGTPVFDTIGPLPSEQPIRSADMVPVYGLPTFKGAEPPPAVIVLGPVFVPSVALPAVPELSVWQSMALGLAIGLLFMWRKR